jgi:DNA-binding NarL/FixJ family response regulator
METPTVPYTILLVDDAPAVREALRWALEGTGDLAVVGEAGDGIAAVERAAALAPDAIILDLELPGQDGCAVARAVKSQAPAPVVIVLTIHNDPASRQRSLAAGADAFVAKADGWPTLITTIRHALQSARPAQSPRTTPSS